MNAFLYGVALQWKLDIRSKALLITCYLVPLLFFAVMGGIFVSINPDSKETLIPSMTVLGVSMGALIGLPPSLSEIYGSDIKKVYKANGVPLYMGMVTIYLSAFAHLMMMGMIIYIAAPIAFGAKYPTNIPVYFCSLALFIAASLGIGCMLGLSVKNQSKLNMISQVVFLPSIMLTGILFPVELLPKILKAAGKALPATWGYLSMTGGRFQLGSLWPLGTAFLAAVILCTLLLKKLKAE